MKSLGGNGIFIREVWLKNRAVRVSGSNPKAARDCLKKQEPRLRKKLVAQLELLGNRLVTAEVRALQIFEQAAALADHDQQATARAVIFLVGLEMLRQMVDAVREQRDLDIGGTGVFGVHFELFNCFRLRFHRVSNQNRY